MESFESFWGFSAVVASMPHHACLSAVGDMLYDMGFIAFDNTHMEGSPLLSTLRVGFEPCCIPISVERARRLVEWTIEEADGLINVQSHAQNFHSSTTPAREHMRRMQELVELVLHLRRTYPRMVFVTVSELMQLKAQGWSREVWPDRLVYRNHESDPMFVPIDAISDWFTDPAWSRVSPPQTSTGQRPADLPQEGATGNGAAQAQEVDRVWAVYVHQVLYGTRDREVAQALEAEAVGGTLSPGHGENPSEFECRVLAEGETLELLPGRYYAVLRAAPLPPGSEQPDVRDCALWRDRLQQREREGVGGLEHGEELGGETEGSETDGNSGGVSAGGERKGSLGGFYQAQGASSYELGDAPEECFPHSVSVAPDTLVAGKAGGQRLVVREVRAGGGGGCPALSGSGESWKDNSVRDGPRPALLCQFWREVDGLDLGTTALVPIGDKVVSRTPLCPSFPSRAACLLSTNPATGPSLFVGRVLSKDE